MRYQAPKSVLFGTRGSIRRICTTPLRGTSLHVTMNNLFRDHERDFIGFKLPVKVGCPNLMGRNSSLGCITRGVWLFGLAIWC